MVARVRLDWWLAALLGGVGFVLAVWQADRPSLYFDEAYAVGLASQPLSVMAHYLWGQECQMTLYYLLLHGWLGLLDLLGAGRGELLLRMPSLIVAGLAASALYLLAAHWWGRTTGIVAALVFATNPVLLRQAQETRSYALQVLLLTLTWLAFLAAIEAADGDRRWRLRSWWIAFATLLTLAVYAQIDSTMCALAFLVALAALVLLPGTSGEAARWRLRARASIPPFVLSAFGVLLATLPLLIDAMLHGGGNGWVLVATPHLLAQMVRANFLAGVGWLLWPLLLATLLAIFPTLRLRAWKLLLPFRPPTLAALAWLVVILALFYLLPLHLFHWRYLVVVVTPFALLVGIGVSRIRFRIPRALVVLLLLASVVQLPPAYYATGRDDYRTAARWLDARIQPGDGVVCWPALYCAVPMSYYVTALAGDGATYPGVWRWAAHSSADQLPIASNPPLSDSGDLDAYLATQQRVWVILAPHGTPLSLVLQDERDEQRLVMAAGFQPGAGARIDTNQVAIILYERPTTPTVPSVPIVSSVTSP